MVSKPTEAKAKALAKYFPSAKSTSSQRAFDPAAECVVLGPQKKKKAAIRPKQRPVNISIVMMQKYSPVVPKGKECHKLASQGRMLNMKVSRGMNAKELKDKISGAFHVSDYTILECANNGHTLVKCFDQEIDGDAIAQRHGCLYLCEAFQVSLLYSILITLLRLEEGSNLLLTGIE